MDKDVIRQARQANLPAYLINRGEELEFNGRRYRHKQHQSLVFTANAYFWNSKNEHGNAVDFLMRFYGMDFDTAVNELTKKYPERPEGQKKVDMPVLVGTVNFSFASLNLSSDMRRSIAYLTKTRSIDTKIIQNLTKEKYIFQETGTNNIVFPVYDENESIVGAETAGTLSDVRFKGVKDGSKYGYGFNISFEKPLIYALFFESAIDLISFIEIRKERGKNLKGCLLVSMAGLKENIINHTLKVFKGEFDPLEAVLCVDSDEAGKNFVDSFKGQNGAFRSFFPDEPYKDWNEQLKTGKKGKFGV